MGGGILLNGIEVFSVCMLGREPGFVRNIAPVPPIDFPAELLHSPVDRRRPILAYIRDDCGLSGTQNEASLVRRFLSGICAIQIRHQPDRAAGCRADTGSSSRANSCAGRPGQSAKQGAYADPEGRSQRGMRILGIDLYMSKLVTMNHPCSVNRDVSTIVQLP